MDNQDRREAFLAKARQAEEQAEKSKGSHARDSWLLIAQSYRQLAEYQALKHF